MVGVGVLNEQEAAFSASVEESVTTLLPLSTLEHYLQRALVDELEEQTGESSPNLPRCRIPSARRSPASSPSTQGTGIAAEMTEAEQAWISARPRCAA